MANVNSKMLFSLWSFSQTRAMPAIVSAYTAHKKSQKKRELVDCLPNSPNALSRPSLFLWQFTYILFSKKSEWNSFSDLHTLMDGGLFGFYPLARDGCYRLPFDIISITYPIGIVKCFRKIFTISQYFNLWKGSWKNSQSRGMPKMKALSLKAPFRSVHKVN